MTAVTRPLVSMRRVSVRVPRRPEPVLADVDLDVRRGERVLVLGASGSGKSTLLHAMSGVVPHSVNADVAGTVRVGGVDVADTSVVELSRTVGVVAQDPAAAVTMASVEQEIALALENRAVPRPEIAPRIAAALGPVGAAHLRTRGTGALSGGEAQRIALAATAVARPDLLLLDEPTAMLDPAGVASVRRAVRAVSASHAPTVVLVEHRLDEFAGPGGLAHLPERTVVLAGGRVVADGPTVDVLRSHAAQLHAGGCWLPLESELFALTGVPGGLEAAANRDRLRDLARRDEPPGRGGEQLADAEVVLEARGLAVTPETGRRAGREAARPLLAGVDLTVRRGEIVAVLGANGVGKTTLLLALAGLFSPAAGDVAGPRPGMVFQNPEHQFLAHRVRDEIAVGLPGTTAEIAAVVEERLARHGLAEVADASPYRLSGGEKRRLSLAAMLAHGDRPVLLADEPTFGLDRAGVAATAAALRHEAGRGRAVVFSSHDLRLVAALAHRVVVLGDHGVLADGPTPAVLRRADVVRRAGLVLPELVRWLLTAVDDAAVAGVLRGLDGAFRTARPTVAVAGGGQR